MLKKIILVQFLLLTDPISALSLWLWYTGILTYCSITGFRSVIDSNGGWFKNGINKMGWGLRNHCGCKWSPLVEEKKKKGLCLTWGDNGKVSLCHCIIYSKPCMLLYTYTDILKAYMTYWSIWTHTPHLTISKNHFIT